jgi:uracil-DNA glycosylase family protein
VPSAQEFIPTGEPSLTALAEAATGCRGCDLYRHASQTVFGRGPADASVMLVGEQPGDQEDRAGAPFVGPAGKILDDALREAGVDRATTYVTNAVKHFKFTRSWPDAASTGRSASAGDGPRRIHQTPGATEIVACRPWLLAEMRLVRPRVLVLLGATAGKALLGSSFTVNRNRGGVLNWPRGAPPEVAAIRLLATIHPSAVLRAENQGSAYAGLVADLSRVPTLLDSPQ